MGKTRFSTDKYILFKTVGKRFKECSTAQGQQAQGQQVVGFFVFNLNNDQQLSSSRKKAQWSEFFKDLNRIKTNQNKW